MSFVNEQQRKEERIALEQSSLGYLLTIASDEKELTKLLLRLQKIDWLDPIHRQIFKALLDGRLSHARIVEGLSFNRIQVPEGQVSAFDYLLRLEEQALGAYLVEELYRLDAEEKISTSLKASDYETAHRQLMLMMTGEGSVPDLQILRFSDLKKMSGPEWLIEGYLPKHALCTLYGESGSYKSFIALDMCLSIALDQNWAGRRVSSGKIAYIAGEGEKGLRNRVEGWLAKNHHEAEAIEASFFTFARAVDPTSEPMRNQLIGNIKEVAGEVDLIVFDTLAKCNSGDENSQRDMSAFIAGVDVIKSELNCSVLLIHHTGYSSTERERGSSVLRAAVDTSVMLKRGSAPLTVDLTVQKQKDDGKAEGMRLKGLEIELENDKSTLVFEKSENFEDKPKRPKLSSNQVQVHRLIVEIIYQYGEMISGRGYPDGGVRGITTNGWSKACNDAGINGGMTAFLKAKFPDASNPSKTLSDIVKKGYLAKHAVEQIYWVVTD